MTIASERKSVENIHDFAGLACACCPPRRGFLSRLAALGAAAVLPGELMAQGAKKAPAAARGKPYRIDVHHHLMYPGYLQDAGRLRAGSTFKWSPDMPIEDIDKRGVAVSLMSPIQPNATTAH